MKTKFLTKTNLFTKNKFLTDTNEFENIIHELLANPTVQEMKNYRQHFSVSCFDHCYCASFYCYMICKILGFDYKSATRAAMLHDMFLYDWRDKNSHQRFHAFHHGKTACQNACKVFNLSQKEQDIIIRHMWPVTFAFPNSFEGFILTFVDKYCALKEAFETFKKFTYSKNFFRYAYLFLGILVVNMY